MAAASFSIYANRIIFCEGTESSYDQAVLRAFYNSRHDAVVPVGSCRDVANCAEAFTKSAVVQGMTAIGIVDRDYWPDAYLNSLPECVKVLPVHEVESLFCHKDIFAALARHLGLGMERAEAAYHEFLKEAAAKFKGAVEHKQISERFKNRCVGQFDSAVNSLRVSEDLDRTRQDHKTLLDPDSWTCTPASIWEQEASVVQRALSIPEDGLLRVLPGKVYLPILLNKLSIRQSVLVGLVTASLTAKDDDPLHLLGQELRAALTQMLPTSQERQDAEACLAKP